MGRDETYHDRFDRRLVETLREDAVEYVRLHQYPPGRDLVKTRRYKYRLSRSVPVDMMSRRVTASRPGGYLHAIPAAEERLHPPAAGSAYEGDTVSALLDGDLLQARAFVRISSLPERPRTISRCNRLL